MPPITKILLCLSVAVPFHVLVAAENDYPVGITANLPYLDLHNNEKPLRIQRNQDGENMIDLEFAITSRNCPPYCLQPISLAPGVETIGELELLEYIRVRDAGDHSILIIDSRTEEWLQKGMIPLAINIPWNSLSLKTAEAKSVAEILEFQFDAIRTDGLWNFENAKTLVLYCNGPWCGQSPTSIRTLLALGYPPHKIKWYRMGMQGWKLLGLTTTRP